VTAPLHSRIFTKNKEADSLPFPTFQCIRRQGDIAIAAGFCFSRFCANLSSQYRRPWSCCYTLRHLAPSLPEFVEVVFSSANLLFYKLGLSFMPVPRTGSCRRQTAVPDPVGCGNFEGFPRRPNNLHISVAHLPPSSIGVSHLSEPALDQ